MLQFENLKTNYLSDCLGKIYLDESIITTEKSKLRQEITLEECKDILGRKYKVCIHRMLPICSFILSHYNSSFIQLSTTFNYTSYIKHLFYNNLPLLDTFKVEEEANIKSNQRALQDMQALGFIRKVSDIKHFNDSNHLNNVSYAYVFSTSFIYTLLSLLHITFIYHYSINNNLPLLDTFAEESKHSKLYKEYLPKLQYELSRQTVAGEFKYNLKENGSRPYAYFCSSENKKSNERKEILNSYFGKGNWIEWDRSASIYNLTYSYNTKKYIDNSVDFHSLLNKRQFKSKEEREELKLLNMTKYFSDARKVRKLMESMIAISEKVAKMEPLTAKELSFYKNNLDRVNVLVKLSKAETVQDVVDYYKNIRKDMVDFLGGKKIDNDAIFIMEGTVNLATMNDLNEAGYKCVSVYDGFYTDCKDEEFIEELYKKNIMKYIIGK